MNGPAPSLQPTCLRAYLLGAALGLGTPALIALLLLARVVPPGPHPPEGLYEQLGYLCTGLVFLSAAWVLWRRGQTLRDFGALPEARRPAVILRETLLYALVCEASSLLGLVYWVLMGAQDPRHAWGFILLTPMLFVALVPRPGRWQKALEG